MVQESPESQGIDRRQFVKGAVTVAGVGAVGATGFGIVKPLSIVAGGAIKTVTYWGAKVLRGSPAPRGIPLIKVIVNADGFLEGVPDERLDWYKYCSHEGAPGLQGSYNGDNVLRYFLTKDKLEAAGGAATDLYWYADRLGREIHIDDIRRRPLGDGVAFNWRSQGASGGDIVTGILMKLDLSRLEAGGRFPEDLVNKEENLLAVCSFCTHFCCVPGFKDPPAKGVAESYDAWEKIFCTCHNSRYDPLVMEQYSYDLKEAEDEEGGAGHA